MKHLKVLFSIAVFICMSHSAMAYTVRYQQGTTNQFNPNGYSGVQDTCLYSLFDYTQYSVQDNLNYGAAETLKAGWDENVNYNAMAYSLIRFQNAPALPVGSWIESARLYFFIKDGAGWTLLAHPMYIEDQDWVAGTSNGQVEQYVSCWKQKRYGYRNWYHPIQEPYYGWPNWRDQTCITFTATGRTISNYKEVYADIPISQAFSQAGFYLYGHNIPFGDWSGTLCEIASSESSNPALRPALELTIVPEPSSFATLATGVCGLLVFKKRRKAF